jgi:hypothetical protein
MIYCEFDKALKATPRETWLPKIHYITSEEALDQYDDPWIGLRPLPPYEPPKDPAYNLVRTSALIGQI